MRAETLARIWTSWAISRRRAGWVTPEISTRCNCQRKHLHWLENPPWWSMIPHWKSNGFLTSSGMKAMKKMWGHFTEKEYPHLFHFFYQPWKQPQMLLKRPDFGKQLQNSLKSNFVGDRSVPFNKSNAADWRASKNAVSHGFFFMATCHRSRSSTARRLAVVKQPTVDTSTATVANDGDQCRKSAEVSILSKHPQTCCSVPFNKSNAADWRAFHHSISHWLFDGHLPQKQIF